MSSSEPSDGGDSRGSGRAGFAEGQGLAFVSGVGVYVLSTFANRGTRAELDAPFVPFAWKRD